MQGATSGCAKCGEAVQDGGAHLELRGPTVERARGQALPEQLDAVHLGLGAASAVIPAAYVSTAAIEQFVTSYASLSQVAKLMGVHPKTASIVLAGRVAPVSHPSAAGIRPYHRQDIETFLRGIDAAGGSGIGRPPKGQNREEKGLNWAESTETGYFGEIDASIR